MPIRSKRREKVRSRERLSKLNRSELVQLIYDIRKDNIALEERCARLERQLSDAEARMLSDETNARLDNIENALREIGVRLFPELIDDEAEAEEIMAAEAAEAKAMQAASTAPAAPAAPAEPREPEAPAAPEKPAIPEELAAPAEPETPAPIEDRDVLTLPIRPHFHKAQKNARDEAEFSLDKLDDGPLL